MKPPNDLADKLADVARAFADLVDRVAAEFAAACGLPDTRTDPMTPEDSAFVARVHENPNDTLPRLVQFDYWEEGHAGPELAEFAPIARAQVVNDEPPGGVEFLRPGAVGGVRFDGASVGRLLFWGGYADELHMTRAEFRDVAAFAVEHHPIRTIVLTDVAAWVRFIRQDDPAGRDIEGLGLDRHARHDAVLYLPELTAVHPLVVAGEVRAERRVEREKQVFRYRVGGRQSAGRLRAALVRQILDANALPTRRFTIEFWLTSKPGEAMFATARKDLKALEVPL